MNYQVLNYRALKKLNINLLDRKCRGRVDGCKGIDGHVATLLCSPYKYREVNRVKK